jgi:thioredoxin 2
MAPAYEQAAREWEDRVAFAKLNTDDEQAIAQRYDIRSIPTMILFQDGQEVARHSGAMTGSAIDSWLEASLAEPAA